MLAQGADAPVRIPEVEKCCRGIVCPAHCGISIRDLTPPGHPPSPPIAPDCGQPLEPEGQQASYSAAQIVGPLLAGRQAFEHIRMQAGALFATGRSQAEVARTLGVARQNVSRWPARWQAGGLQALASRRSHRAGPAPVRRPTP